MKRLVAIGWLALVGALGVLPARAQAPAAATTPAAENPEQRKRLIDQKIRLLELLLNSPAAKAAAYGTEAETTTLVEHGKSVIARARQEAAEGRFDEAGKTLDEAMKVVTKATRRQPDASFADSAQRKTYADQTDQIATYRKSVVDLTRDAKVGEAAKTLLASVDALVAEAVQLSADARLGEANKKLAAAYKLVTEDIARLRQGNEVVMSLKFDSPADEYAYEEKRFGSNQIMVDMLVSEGKGDGDRRKLIDRYLEEAGKLKREAEVQANNGTHKEAVKLMERANGQLVRALQLMGVPVF